MISVKGLIYCAAIFRNGILGGSGIEVFSLTKMISAKSVCKLKRSKTCKSVEKHRRREKVRLIETILH